MGLTKNLILAVPPSMEALAAHMAWCLAAILAYMAGCANTGYYLVRLRMGADIRALHSGTAGARNTGRILGWGGFLTAFAGDAGKGWLVMAAAVWLQVPPERVPWLLPTVVAGHIWPMQLRFRGGKGLATAFGGSLAWLLPVGKGMDFFSGCGVLAFALAWGTVLFAHSKYGVHGKQAGPFAAESERKA